LIDKKHHDKSVTDNFLNKCSNVTERFLQSNSKDQANKIYIVNSDKDKKTTIIYKSAYEEGVSKLLDDKKDLQVSK
jgi:hypothetical protein